MASIPDHPNDPGTGPALGGRNGFVLWHRERQALANRETCAFASIVLGGVDT